MAGTVFSVANSAELYAALANADGGDTIELAGGDYGNLRIGSNVGQFASNLTITSADPSTLATFSGLNVNGATNITFDSVVFDYTYSAGDAAWLQPFGIYSSTGISILNSTFDGDVPTGVSIVDDGVGAANGLYVRDSSAITFEGNEMYTFKTGLTFLNSSDINVINNDVYGIRSDGMDFIDVQGVLIESNYLHDFQGAVGSQDHRDMIQFWTAGTDSPSTDIIIRNNLLDVGEEGDWTQSIFMGNEQVARGLAGPEMFYQNVLIENNTIYNSHLQAIMVGETDGLIVQNNSVIQAEGRLGLEEGAISVPVINIAANSTNVQILSNITERILGFNGQSDWTMQNNAFIQNSDPNAPGYYSDNFFPSSMTATDGANGFVVIPGSMVDALGAGSTAVQPDDTDSMVDALGAGSTAVPPAPDTTPEPTPESQPVDESFHPLPQPAPDTTSEPTPESPPVDESFHPLPQPAPDSTLEPTPESQPVDETFHSLPQPTPELAPELTPATTLEPMLEPAPEPTPAPAPILDDFILEIEGLQKTMLGDDASIIQTADGSAIRLDGRGDYVDLGQLAQFDGAEQISIAVDFTNMSSKGGEQRLFLNEGDINLSVVGDSLKLDIGQSGKHGRTFYDSLKIDGLGINDGAEHTATMILDAEADRLQVLVDDKVVYDQDADVNTFGQSFWTLGSPKYHGFDGMISGFRIEEGADFVEEIIVADDASLVV